MRLHRALKSLEGAEGRGHGIGRDEAGIEDARSEPRDFAVFVEGLELMCDNACDFEPAGIGTDIDGGKGGHRGGCAVSEEGENLFCGQDTRRE